jgi:uncharacterized protein YggE
MKEKKTRYLVPILFALVFSACAPAVNMAAETPDRNAAEISVTGSSRVLVTPDIAYINVGVRSQANSVAEALDKNKQQAQAIKEVLVDSGIAEEDIQTTSFNVYPQSNYDYQGNITSTYFAVENTVFITIRNLDVLGATLDAVARSGANNIYGINFDVSDKTEAQSTARTLAVESARIQAEELAEAAGVVLGDLVSISTSASSPAPYYGYGMGGGGEVYEAVPISSGQIPVNISLTMVFTIQ